MNTKLFNVCGEDFYMAMEAYLDHIRGDYCAWNKNETEFGARMRDEFILGARIELGSKYAKVVTRGSVHSFVVLRDGNKWKRGDILKAATYAAPATNFVRGNVLSGAYKHATWTGIA